MSAPEPGRHPLLLSLAILLALTGLVGCSDSSEAPAATRPASTETVSLTANPVTTSSKVARVYGPLPKARRGAVRRKVAAAVDAWWDSAYLAGDYPRTSFPGAFPRFTAGAEAKARRDKRLMTNLDIGARIDSVTAKRRHLVLDVLATRGTARSVTARFVLRFRTTGAKERLVTVRGRLFLTRRNGTWKVFGYDVAKGSRA